MKIIIKLNAHYLSSLQLVLESENIVHYDEIRMCPSPRSFEDNLSASF